MKSSFQSKYSRGSFHTHECSSQNTFLQGFFAGLKLNWRVQYTEFRIKQTNNTLTHTCSLKAQRFPMFTVSSFVSVSCLSSSAAASSIEFSSLIGERVCFRYILTSAAAVTGAASSTAAATEASCSSSASNSSVSMSSSIDSNISGGT